LGLGQAAQATDGGDFFVDIGHGRSG
jgi:hypothetical protein